MVNNSIIITDEFISKKWLITASYNNNKMDKYIVTSLELAKFINRSRRSAKREDKESMPKLIYPMDSWLIDLILKKCKEYIEYFKMKDTGVIRISIETKS